MDDSTLGPWPRVMETDATCRSGSLRKKPCTCGWAPFRPSTQARAHSTLSTSARQPDNIGYSLSRCSHRATPKASGVEASVRLATMYTVFFCVSVATKSVLSPLVKTRS